MEEILSSIKRIIAEEEAPTGRRRAAVRPLAPPPPPEPEEDEESDDGVLELNDPMPPGLPEPEPVRAVLPPQPAEPAPQPPERDLLVSPAAADATRGALQSLSKLAVKAEPQSDGSLEGVVREMLRPMLREWLDARLPEIVEAMVAKEIARISGRQP